MSARVGWIFCVAAACGAGASDPPDDPGCWEIPAAPELGEVELGTGLDAFEPVAPEQALPLIRGPQGGHHLIVNARVRGMNPGVSEAGLDDVPRTLFGAALETGEKIDIFQCPFVLEYEAVDGSQFQLPRGQPLIIYEEFVPGLAERRVRITVQIVDPDGRFASDERWVVVSVADGADGGTD